MSKGNLIISSFKGFTLIELLIVIAIILILIAIALPNFLEAQIRARIARVKADQRTLTVALESYALDNHGDYPPYRRWGTHGNPRYFNVLTSPVAYLTNIDAVRDPFFDHEIDEDLGLDRYGYYSDGMVRGTNFRMDEGFATMKNSLIQVGFPGAYSIRYCITCPGPDTVLQLDGGPFILYSATNGTKSIGDIHRLGPFNSHP